MNVKDYIEIRQVGKELNNKIIQSDKKALVYAAKKLGFWYNDKLVTEDEYDIDILMNFIVFEKGKNAYSQLERFYDSDVELSDIEEEIIEAKMDSFPSLFRLTGIDGKNSLCTFQDLFDEHRTEYQVMDLGFAKSAQEDILIYSRLIPIRDIHITSGVSFGFMDYDEQRIRKDISSYQFKKRRRLSHTDIYILMNTKHKQYSIQIGGIEL